jgi:hypothetical protein
MLCLHHEDATNTFYAAKGDVVEHGILDLTKELIFLNLDFLIILLVLGRKTTAPDDQLSELSSLQMTKRSVENASAMRLAT